MKYSQPYNFMKIKQINQNISFCHRRKDRTIRISGKYFPVCARCTGVYLGIFFFFLFQFFIKIELTFNILIMSLLFMLPMTIDGLTQLFRLRESINSIRLFSGFMGGIGYSILLLLTIRLIKNILVVTI